MKIELPAVFRAKLHSGGMVHPSGTTSSTISLMRLSGWKRTKIEEPSLGDSASARQNFGILVKHVQLLALTGEEQLAAYPDGVCKGDELALDFEWVHSQIWRLEEAGLITANSIAILNQINQRLSEMSGPDGPWSDDDVRHAPEWVDIRSLAKTALESLGAI